MTRRRLFPWMTAAIVATALVATPVAQEQGTGAEEAIRSIYLADDAALEKKLVALAEAFSEKQYDWRPGPGVRSVREVFAVIIGENAALVPEAFDAPAMLPFAAGPPGFDAIKTAVATAPKAEIVDWLRRSFGTLRTAWTSADPASLGNTHVLFGIKMPASRMAIVTMVDQHEHLGQLIAYARTNGVVPPWSKAPLP
jgi:DinB superfamily